MPPLGVQAVLCAVVCNVLVALRQVALSVYSGSAIRVDFSASIGDAVTKYKVEWDTNALLTLPSSWEVNTVGLSAPFTYVIPSLTKGTSYYVQVRGAAAACAQSRSRTARVGSGVQRAGLRQPAACDAVSGVPARCAHARVVLAACRSRQRCVAELPSEPRSVVAYPTSGRPLDGKITVGWLPPADNGGDAVTSYTVKWDVSSSMQMLTLPPHKGSVEVDASNSSSVTISSLTIGGRGYWFTVAARNSVGARPIVMAVPATPSLQVRARHPC